MDIDLARFFVLCGSAGAEREETATRLDVAPPKHVAVAPVARRRTDSGASMDRFRVGAIADAGGSLAPKVLA